MVPTCGGALAHRLCWPDALSGRPCAYSGSLRQPTPRSGGRPSPQAFPSAGSIADVLSGTAAGGTPASARVLDRRAGHVAEGTEDAAIALQRSQDRTAMTAVVEILTSVRRHRFNGQPAAFRTGKGRSQLNHAPPSSLISGASMKLQKADRVTKMVERQSMTNVARDGGTVVQPLSRAQARFFRR